MLAAHVVGAVKKGNLEEAETVGMGRVMGGHSFLVARIPLRHDLLSSRITPRARDVLLYAKQESLWR